jgi:glycine/D-amino acid oxidase-like deaminating enzyme
MPIPALPSCEYIIIGGGAVGLGVAHELARAGKTDLLLLERADDVAQATTSQGAGLCGQVRDSAERIKLAMHSVATFRHLQQAEVKPDWHEVGSLRLAFSEKRAAEFRRLKTAADAAGLETSLIDGPAAARLWPPMDFSSAKSILWCPTDGWMTPRCVAKAYEHACRQLGVRFATSTTVEEIVVRNGRVTGVKTNRGAAESRFVINAAGAHAWHIARLVGLELPIVPVRHEYFVTVAMAGLTPDLPCFRIPELILYGRVRDGGLLLGGWEPNSLHLDPHAYDLRQMPPPVEPDEPVLNSFAQSLAPLFPAVTTASKATVGKGWPTFTPDGRFIIGESTRVPGFVMAGGCNAHGISGSAGIGRLLVESLLDPKPSDYVRSLSPDRFTESEWSWNKACVQAARVYETYYGV